MKNKTTQRTNDKSSFLQIFKLKKQRRKATFFTTEEHFLTETETFATGLWRAMRIFFHYMRGFYAFRHVQNCVTVFGSARFKENHPYYQLGLELGSALAKQGFTVMTGGGPGLMEAVNKGAHDAKGLSVSCNIQGTEFEQTNPYVTTTIVMKYFFVRKIMLTKYSLAFIALPGGLGTLDELFEMATLIQTGKIKNFPLVLMIKEFWQPLINFLQNTMVANGTIRQSDLDKIFVTDSPEEAIQFICNSLIHMSKHELE